MRPSLSWHYKSRFHGTWHGIRYLARYNTLHVLVYTYSNQYLLSGGNGAPQSPVFDLLITLPMTLGIPTGKFLNFQMVFPDHVSVLKIFVISSESVMTNGI